MRLDPSGRSTIRSTSRTDLPVASTLETIDRRTPAIQLKKERALVEFFVRLPGLWCPPPEGYRVTIVLKDGTMRDERRDWQKIEKAIGYAQHGAEHRLNRPAR